MEKSKIIFFIAYTEIVHPRATTTKLKKKKHARVRGCLKPSPSYMVFETMLWVEANAELAGFRRKRRRNFEEMQLIYEFNK